MAQCWITGWDWSCCAFSVTGEHLGAEAGDRAISDKPDSILHLIWDNLSSGIVGYSDNVKQPGKKKKKHMKTEITVSQTGYRCKGPLEFIWSHYPAQIGSPGAGCPGLCAGDIWIKSEVGDSKTFLGNFHCSPSQWNSFPGAQTVSPVFQLVPSVPVAGQDWTEPSSVLFVPYRSGIYMHLQDPPEPSQHDPCQPLLPAWWGYPDECR